MTDSVVSFNGTLVLHALEVGSGYGLEVMEATELASGTVYPLLRRFEARGLVESSWEDEEEAGAEGRPARRYYRVTPAGREALEQSIAYYRRYRAFLDTPPERA